ncbi:hypothetical protein DPMN_099771 [Dreissena polymorpha]|uniref:Uncharacterized protein n=1 Tax=Dreissena polymorpha TaxID=45954 RepID=A0A9D4LHW6_DREPO|nr:hypothetical protein DPMN_099771 [Dreissena polymorpha]
MKRKVYTYISKPTEGYICTRIMRQTYWICQQHGQCLEIVLKFSICCLAVGTVAYISAYLTDLNGTVCFQKQLIIKQETVRDG